jgi:hypothetical protein
MKFSVWTMDFTLCLSIRLLILVLTLGLILGENFLQ